MLACTTVAYMGHLAEVTTPEELSLLNGLISGEAFVFFFLQLLFYDCKYEYKGGLLSSETPGRCTR